jgi:hypothetical protein
MVEEPITMGEGPILYLLAHNLVRFVGWEWVSDGYRLSCDCHLIHLVVSALPLWTRFKGFKFDLRSSLWLRVECGHSMLGFMFSYIQPDSINLTSNHWFQFGHCNEIIHVIFRCCNEIF